MDSSWRLGTSAHTRTGTARCRCRVPSGTPGDACWKMRESRQSRGIMPNPPARTNWILPDVPCWVRASARCGHCRLLRLFAGFVRRPALGRWLVVSHRLLKGSDSLAQALAEFTHLFRAKDEHRDHRNDQQVHWLEHPLEHVQPPG